MAAVNVCGSTVRIQDIETVCGWCACACMGRAEGQFKGAKAICILERKRAARAGRGQDERARKGEGEEYWHEQGKRIAIARRWGKVGQGREAEAAAAAGPRRWVRGRQLQGLTMAHEFDRGRGRRGCSTASEVKRRRKERTKGGRVRAGLAEENRRLQGERKTEEKEKEEKKERERRVGEEENG